LSVVLQRNATQPKSSQRKIASCLQLTGGLMEVAGVGSVINRCLVALDAVSVATQCQSMMAGVVVVVYLN
jgi:hypothetical protein